MDAVADLLGKRWGKLNVLIHSIAFAPKEDLHGRVTDVSLPGFLTAMEVSVWPLVRLTQLLEGCSPRKVGASSRKSSLRSLVPSTKIAT
jgi:enoyl-[acyl-carrier protein] reductase I